MIKIRRWANKYDNCIKCLSSKYIHHAHGLCVQCYIKQQYKTKTEYIPRIGWSREYNYCLECSTDSVKHIAKGLCKYCYYKKYNKDNLPKS